MATELIKYKYTVDGKEAEKTLLSLEGASERFKKSILGIGTAGVVFGGFAFAAADMASDLEESKNVVVQALGDMSDEVIAWSENSINSMGISQTQALKTAGVFANLGTSLGLSSQDAALMAVELTQLSADMSSFFNIGQDVAANALKGVFTGESEALKEYGIIMNEATLSAYGYNDSMTEAEKIQARYNLIMDQTKNAQGDFARTSDGLANQIRILKEQIKALVTELGQKFMPVVNEVVKTLNDGLAVAIAVVKGDTDSLTDSQQAMLETFQKIMPIIKTAATVVAVLAAAYGAYTIVMGVANGIIGAATALQGLWTIATAEQTVAQLALDTALLPFIAIVVAIIAVIAAVIAIMINWSDITTYVQQKWQELKDFLKQWATDVYNTFVTWATAVVEAVKTWAIETFNNFKEWALSVLGVIRAWAAVAVALVVGTMTIWKTIFTAGLTFIKDEVTLVFTAIRDTIKGIMTSIRDTIKGIWDSIKEIFGGTLGLIKGIVTGDMDLIKTSINSIMNGIKGIYQSIWNGIKGIFSSVLNGIIDIVTGTMENIKNTISTIMNSILDTIKGVLDSIKNAFSTTFQFIYDNTIGKLLDLKDRVTDIVGGIGDSVSAGLSKINPFDSPALQLTPQFFGTGGAGTSFNTSNTEINYNIYSNARQMTTREMHKQAQAARVRGASKNVR